MADTALSIGCRKAIEAAGRLSTWLERSDALASEVKPVIETTLDHATLDLRRIMRSIELRPCVGIVGGPDRHKIELASSALLSPGSTINELSDLRRQLPNFETLLEQLAGNDLGTALRFRSGGTRPPAGEDYRFPLQVELLSTLDVVKIITTAHYTHVPGAGRAELSHADIEQAIARADRELSAAAVSGISAQDISNLRHHLWSEFPRVESLRMLATSGYWDWLANHVAHLSIEGRAEMLSYLWHFDPHFTALFKCLTQALRDLGYATSVRVPLDAILGTDPETGGVASHAASLVRQATVNGLLRDGPPAADLSVAVGQGTVRATSRATLAALAHSLTFRVSRAAPYPLENTDLKLFPSPPPSRDLSLGLAGTGDIGAGVGAQHAEQLYARCKTAYEFARACTSNELAAIVVLGDVDTLPDDTHMRAVSDWIELSEGADPRARERMENCLGVIIKAPDEVPDETAAHGPASSDARRRFLAGLLGENNRWVQEWTPGRPFSQIHFVPTFAAALPPAIPAAPRDHLAVAAEDGIFPARVPSTPPPTAAASILLDIAANSSQVIRQRQIRRQLVTIQRAMQARIFRYHRSNNPAQFTDWRRQIANVATKRLEACAEDRQLGNMLAALSLGEADVYMLLAGLKGGAFTFNDETDERPLDIEIGRAALPDPDICAEATVAAWLKLMHEAAGSRQLCGQLNIAQPVFQHIIDEIVIGIHRADLVGILTRKFVRTLETGRPLNDLARSYAVVAARTLGSYLERLSVAPVQRPAAAMLPPPPPGVPAAGPQPYFDMSNAVRPSADKPHRNTGRWPTLFRRMVDGNIIAAEGLTAHSEADHELGEYLAMLASNPLEVEL